MADNSVGSAVHFGHNRFDSVYNEWKVLYGTRRRLPDSVGPQTRVIRQMDVLFADQRPQTRVAAREEAHRSGRRSSDEQIGSRQSRVEQTKARP